MRLTVRAKPGSKHVRVRWHPADNIGNISAGTGRTNTSDDLRGGFLEVAVRARAVEGKANESVRDAVAEALGVRRSSVSIVRGHTHRVKIVEVDEPDHQVRAALSMLADEGQGSDSA